MAQFALPAPVEISTRDRLQKTNLLPSRSMVVASRPSNRALTTVGPKKRHPVIRALPYVPAVFPPTWPIYFVAWIVHRSRRPQKSMRLVQKAVRLLEKGEPGVALKKLQDAHLLNPQNADALYWLGLLLARQGRHEEAVEALEIVARRAPGLPEVEGALSRAYLELENPEGALHHAQRRFDADPYTIESMIGLAEAFEAVGKFDLAIDTLKQAPIHKRRLSDELVGVVYRIGVLHEKAGDTDEAVAAFKRVYAKDLEFRDVKERLERLEDEPDATD